MLIEKTQKAKKTRKVRLLTTTKGEENRIELITASSQKSWKSKPRKSMNAFNVWASRDFLIWISYLNFALPWDSMHDLGII